MRPLIASAFVRRGADPTIAIVAKRDSGIADARDRIVAKAVARIERGGMAKAIVRRDARRSRPWRSARTDGLG